MIQYTQKSFLIRQKDFMLLYHQKMMNSILKVKTIFIIIVKEYLGQHHLEGCFYLYICVYEKGAHTYLNDFVEKQCTYESIIIFK